MLRRLTSPAQTYQHKHSPTTALTSPDELGGMASSPYDSDFAVKSNVNSPETETASMANSTDLELSTLFKRYEQFALFDKEKAKFVKDLVARVERLTLENQNLKADYRRDYGFIATWQSEKQQYEKWLKNMQRAMSDNPFVMVLIDGDGMIFNNDLLRDGEAGGRRAASQLYAAIQDYVESELMDIPLGIRIVCRIYANVRGLSEVLVRVGSIEEPRGFEDFVRGFTGGKSLFDFIDVGAGKDRADKKIIESLKMFSQDFHCRRLLFGCSHDNGYARTLEECSDRPEVVSKVVLLEGVPFEKELLPLPYSTKKFAGLFRDTKLIVHGGNYIHNHHTTPAGSPSAIVNYNALPGMPTRFPPPTVPRPAGLLDSPLPSRAALALTTLPRTPSSSTLASDGVTSGVKKTEFTWAAKAAAPAPPTIPADSPKYRPMIREEVIARNRAGQRIDPPCKEYDKAEVDRIKKLKMCNVHFLRHECPFNTNCTHTHAYKPSQDEITTLRLVARMAPCLHGSGCQDIKCIYGHRCPAPPSRTGGNKGGKTCIFGDTCKFPPELHDIDTAVVKTLVVR